MWISLLRISLSYENIKGILRTQYMNIILYVVDNLYININEMLIMKFVEIYINFNL